MHQPEPTRQSGIERLHRFLPNAGGKYARDRNSDFGPSDRSNISLLSGHIRHRLLLETEVLDAVLARFAPSTAEKFIFTTTPACGSRQSGYSRCSCRGSWVPISSIATSLMEIPHQTHCPGVGLAVYTLKAKPIWPDLTTLRNSLRIASHLMASWQHTLRRSAKQQHIRGKQSGAQTRPSQGTLSRFS